MIIAVDFDGTLAETEYPRIIAPNMALITYLRQKQLHGSEIILWTMREDEELMEAINFCKAYGLRFDAVNDNLETLKKRFGNNPRKVFADIYIDDRCIDRSKFGLPYRQSTSLKNTKEHKNSPLDKGLAKVRIW